MCFSCKPKKVYHQTFNRMTEGPIKFDQTQIQQLKKKFDKVANYRQDIDKNSFKKNMGILGLKSAFQFSDRLFNSFDIDNDGKISFHDFLQYMQVLKAGSQRHKARISFKLVDYTNKNKFDMKDFKQFLNDFFKSWSSITNITITPQITARTDIYVKMIFDKVKKDKGSDVIDFKYYSQKLYKDKQFIEAFQFITQGVANIFMSDHTHKQNDHSWILYKLLKQLKNIQQTVYYEKFDKQNDTAFQFQDIINDEKPKQVPFAPGYKPKGANFHGKTTSIQKKKQHFNKSPNMSPTNNAYRKINLYNCRQYFFESATQYQTSQYNKQQIQNQTFHTVNSVRSKTNTTDQFSQSNQNLANQKKLAQIQTSIKKIISENQFIFNHLQQKYDRAEEQFYKQKQKGAIKNVHKKIKTTEGNMIFFGDDNWNMVLNMMIGIQMAVRSVRGYQQMICEEPKDFELKYYFQLVPRRFGGQEYQSTIYSFTDYAPNTFNHIRKLFNIDNEQYILSIGPNRLMASLMMGQVNSMTSLTSQGKSGSFFYYTADGKFMLKTIQYRQYKCLKTILKDYYNYIKQNPKTLITRFFGLHKLLQKNQKGQIIGRSYFVIMANVFNTTQKIVQRYDIKGSWYGRQTTDTDPNATKKDLDFLKRKPLQINSRQRQQLIQIIKKDAQFFKIHQIIDYSLLIGVIKNNSSQIRTVKMQSEQVMRNTLIFGQEENDETYILGIIDILTQYDSRKVMQYYFKRTFYGEGISAVPPIQYSDRFVNFIKDVVFKQEEQKRGFFKIEVKK